MASRKDSTDGERFRPKPAAPKARSGPRTQRFVSQVLKAVSKAGADAGSRASGARGARPASTFGRGRVAAGSAGRGLGVNARRVVIKSRFVVLKKAAAGTTAVHLRYIERDGVTRDGQKGQAYGADTDAADLKAFEERGRSDRHQFRFIVSVEDATELDDLKGFTRNLMQRMSVDLETPLDWVAVDHWDTDNPHTHIVLNGHTGGPGRSRQDLVISPDYMAHGMRQRASEIATEWLGPRTELEIREGLLREVGQERLTSLDRQLLRQATVGIVDLTEAPENTQSRQRQTLLRARLQRLEAMVLAGRIDANRWQVAPDMERTLTAMGERGDILRAMHRAMKGEQRELVTDPPVNAQITGRIVAKGLDDELGDRPYLVVDGIDGRAHYLKLPAGPHLAELPVGGIVASRPPVLERPVDRQILAASRGGIYTVQEHQTQLLQAGDRDPQGTAGVHVRRLEALRRAGVVERLADGVWKVPADLLERARQHDAQKGSGLGVELRSHLPIEKQVSALGVTWLDRHLVAADGQGLSAAQGFGAQVREAMDRRVDFLAGQGLAERRGQRIVLARNLLATLRGRELAQVGRDLQQQTGKAWRPVEDGQTASGVYRQSIQLASGRFAMLDDGIGFSLVPWRPVIEQRLGQQMSALVRGTSVNWQFGRTRGISV